jgi:hypothetical protein
MMNGDPMRSDHERQPCINPECRAGKHANCDATAWDIPLDLRVQCECECHMGVNPCG